MARADWQSAGAYEDLRPLDAPAYAFEFLRRNADFLADHARLERKARRNALDDVEAEEFARRWGVRFQARLRPRTTQRRSLDGPGAPERGDSDQNPRPPRRS